MQQQQPMRAYRPNLPRSVRQAILLAPNEQARVAILRQARIVGFPNSCG